MFSWLKKHFIPHEGNEHRPHILRSYSIRSILILIIFIEIVSFLIPTFSRFNTTGNMAAVLPAVLADLTNNVREADSLSILTVNPVLNKAAEMKAEDMAALGYFAHTSPEGKTPWYWLEQVGYQYQYAGENLAINFSDSKDVTDAWMASPTHKANIVKENYTEMGTGVATGMYEGHETVFVAQVYANPLPKVFETAAAPKPKVEVPKKVAIQKTEPGQVLGVEVVTQTAGNMIKNIETKPYVQPSFWQNLLASPRNTTSMFLYIILGIIIIALLLYVIIKIRNHHHDLLINGLLVLIVIGVILAANYYYSHNNMMITGSLDYTLQK